MGTLALAFALPSHGVAGIAGDWKLQGLPAEGHVGLSRLWWLWVLASFGFWDAPTSATEAMRTWTFLRLGELKASEVLNDGPGTRCTWYLTGMRLRNTCTSTGLKTARGNSHRQLATVLL